MRLPGAGGRVTRGLGVPGHGWARVPIFQGIDFTGLFGTVYH